MSAPELAVPGAPQSPIRGDRRFYAFNAVVSVGALAFLGWLLLIRRGGAGGELDLSFVPALNAGFNATAAALLIAGYVAIRRRRREVHRYFMVGAFAASTLFLIGYVAYHYVHGDTRFGGTGAVRVVYLVILATHILMSMTVVPGALTVFWLAARGRFDRHRRVARVVLPIWLYVSVTGVVIYFMLHVMFAVRPEVGS